MTPSSDQPSGTAFLAPGAEDWQALDLSGSAEADKTNGVTKAKEGLKDFLLASLQMQNLVVLAGSGCSISVGGPSMRDLWDSAVGEEPHKLANRIATAVNHSLEDRNIEAFLSKVEAFLQVNDHKGAKKFLEASKATILERCTSFLDASKLDPHTTFLHRLSRRRVRDPRLKVFTTNYDLCFERSAVELGGVALDGFSFTSPRRYDPRYFGYDIIRRPRVGEESSHYLEGVFILHKLHGSVNWARSESGVVEEREQVEASEACLIYPATGKYQQSFLQPHLESMAQYLATLREPNTCLLVVGFGFNDDHLSEPLLVAAKSNPHLRLAIVDINSDTLTRSGNYYWTQFADLSRRGEDVWFIKASFDNFSQLIPDLKSLTPADNLFRTIRSVAGGHA